MKEAPKQLTRNVLTIWKWFLIALRWLAVVIFIILFVIGLFFKFPWKILACLAVIPLVGIFVPQKRQPWAWLAIILIIAAAWIWVMMPGVDSGDWNSYQYNAERETTGLEPQGAPEDNAATLYTTLLNTYDESIFDHPYMDSQMESTLFNRPWDQADYPLLAEWIGRYQPAIDRLLEITRIPQCRFPVPRNLTDRDAQLKRLNQMKGWAMLLIWSANRDLAEGKTDQALEKQLAVLDIAQHLYQQQTLMDQAAAFQVELLAFRALCNFSIESCQTTEPLSVIGDSFENIDTGWAKCWPTIVEREKLVVKNIMGLFYEVDPDGNTRIARSAMYALQEGLGYAPRKLFIRQHEMNRLAVIGLWLSLPTSPHGMAEMVDERFDYYSLQAQKGVFLPAIPIQYTWRMGLNVRSVIDWFAINRVRYFWALQGQSQRHESIIDLMGIFAALKEYYLEHNTWPENLHALTLKGNLTIIDPVYGKPFVYRKMKDGFWLYSLGPNGIDDKGINRPVEKKDDIVFWPRMTTEEVLDHTPPVQQASSLPRSN